MSYKIRFTIGDWSDDGHGKSQTYVVQANKPVEHLRELHLSSPDILGFDIGDICRNYGDSLLSPEIFEALTNHCIPNPFSKLANNIDNIDDGDLYFDTPDELVQLWIDILKHLDKELEAEIVPDNDIPNMHWSGYRDGKHLNVPGYGLFE